MDITRLTNDISSARLIAIGESTHGTHEFFKTRILIFKELITKHGFTAVMLEDRPELCQQIGQYIKGEPIDIHDVIEQLYPVWQVKELSDFIEWLKDNYVTYPTDVFGFDINQMKEDIEKRDQLMAKNVMQYLKAHPKAKGMIWAHNTHIKKSSTYEGFDSMGVFLEHSLHQHYVTVGQFFGIGSFNATHVKEGQPSSDRTLRATRAPSIVPDSLESILDTGSVYILNKEHLLQKGVTAEYKVRSIGWGLDPEEVDDWLENSEPVKEFDWVIYHPLSTPADLL